MSLFPRRVSNLAARAGVALAGLAGLAVSGAGQASAQGSTAGAGGPTETSFFEMFFWSDDPVGLVFIWVLVLLSMLSLTLALRFGLQFRRSALLPAGLAAEVSGYLQQRKFREALDMARKDGSLLGELTAAALAEAPAGYEAMERTLFETGDAKAATTLRPLEALNVLGNIAPMMGLFGTVYGMIVAFQSLVSSGGSPDPVQLAGGISTALVTTLWGLVVAIPALASYALLHNRVDAIAADAMLEAIEAGIPTVVCVTERVPVLDMVRVRDALRDSDTALVGPNSQGILVPGARKLGVMSTADAIPGGIGIAARSASLTSEVVARLSAAGLGQSTTIGIGGDPIHGIGFAHCLALFRDDPGTEAVVLIGELGGVEEEEAADFLAAEPYGKPVIALLVGRHAPEDRRMGHAGTVSVLGSGSIAQKTALLELAGVRMAATPDDVVRALAS